MSIDIYTDGSCLKNPDGPSGWSFIFVEPISDEPILIGSDGCSSSTNNRMELTAIIEALAYIEDDVSYNIYTDSQYVIKCATLQWKRKANLDLWIIFDKAVINKNVTFHWVKAHNGNKYNEMVDSFAKNEAKKFL